MLQLECDIFLSHFNPLIFSIFLLFFVIFLFFCILGTVVSGNYIHDSYGAGIMILGHSTFSHNLDISNNIFIRDGCNQTASDHSGIAFMQDGSNGTLSSNIFVKCPNNVPFFYLGSPNASANWKFENNVFQNNSDNVTPDPVVTIEYDKNNGNNVAYVSAMPPNGWNDSSSSSGIYSIFYTINGERPTQNSSLLSENEKLTIQTATPVLFKMYQLNDEDTKIESSTVGQIIKPSIN